MKVAVITGGSRGIGRSAAIEVAARGTGVILTYNRNADEGHSVAEQITRKGGTAVALKLNLQDTASFDEFSKLLVATLERVWFRRDFDFLVNNAGVGQRTLIKDMTEPMFDELVNVNFKGPFFLTQRLIPLMTDGGHIVNVSSALSRVTFPGVAIYGALKSALETLTRYTAREFADRRLRANVLAPGAIDTEFGGGKGDAAARRHISELTALGRLGEAEDIGKFIAGMLSDDTRFMTAQRIEVSGGIAL